MSNTLPQSILLALLIFCVLDTDSTGQEPPANSSLYFRAKTVAPKLAEHPRPWVDNSGAHAVIGTLLRRQENRFEIQRADGKKFLVWPHRLSSADRVYAQQKTEPRVNPLASTILGRIKSVIDGDTFEFVQLDGTTFTIRAEGIDAPETSQEFSNLSKQFLESHMGHDIRVEYDKMDLYRRVLGQLYFDNRWLNYELVRSGLAFNDIKHFANRHLVKAESHARLSRLGIWSVDELIYPWDWRSGLRKKSKLNDITGKTVYITKHGTRYHTKTCKYAKNGFPIFLNRINSELHPCSVCSPE